MVKAELIAKRTATLETRTCEILTYSYEGDQWKCPFCGQSMTRFEGLCYDCGAEVQVIATKEIDK